MVPLDCFLRFPRLFVAGKPTVAQACVLLRDTQDFHRMEVILRCKGLSSGSYRHVMAISMDNARTEHTLALHPRHPGVHPMTVEVHLWKDGGGHPQKWSGMVNPWGQTGLTILDGRDLGSLKMSVASKAFFGAVIGDLHLPELKTLNDLLNTELQCDWHPVGLTASHVPQSRAPQTNPSRTMADLAAWPRELGSWKSFAAQDMQLFFMEMPVTQKLWHLVTGERFVDFLSEAAPDLLLKMNAFLGDEYPVFGITYLEARSFCDQAGSYVRSESSVDIGWVLRLPGEEEWTRACGRLPQKLADVCFNLSLPGFRRRAGGPMAVTEIRKQLQPNDLGLYSMLGNLCEWCVPAKSDDSHSRGVLLGGSWHHRDLPDHRYRRYSESANRRSSRFGFRMVAAASHDASF